MAFTLINRAMSVMAIFHQLTLQLGDRRCRHIHTTPTSKPDGVMSTNFPSRDRL
jgi:hypothetical protein